MAARDYNTLPPNFNTNFKKLGDYEFVSYSSMDDFWRSLGIDTSMFAMSGISNVKSWEVKYRDTRTGQVYSFGVQHNLDSGFISIERGHCPDELKQLIHQ